MMEKLYSAYRRKFYSRFKHKRGVTFGMRLLEHINQRKLKSIDEEPTPISDLEWDNLIILDACRYDLFQEIVGESDYRITVGSSSRDFIQKTFQDENFKDTVVVTANPHYNENPETYVRFSDLTGKKPQKVFYELFELYSDKDDWNDWNKELNTVLPEKVCERTKVVNKIYPDKKLLVHFMQPHHPFVGSELVKEGIDQELGSNSETVWDLARQNKIEDGDLWEAYGQTLEYAWREVKELIGDLEGKTLVTADHGNFVGERLMYAHPPGYDSEVLRKVPLLELEEEEK